MLDARGRSRCRGGAIAGNAIARRHAMAKPIQTATTQCKKLYAEIGSRGRKRYQILEPNRFQFFGGGAYNLEPNRYQFLEPNRY